MELSQVLEQRPTVTPQLIMANALLQLSSMELEQAIIQELAENPALELVEVQRCPRCGLAISDGRCPSCGHLSFHAETEESIYSEYIPAPQSYGDTDRVDDGISRLASSTRLADHLLQQVRLSLHPQDLPIATCLLERLDDHGFLRCELDEAASYLGVDRARIESVVSALQELEPVGIAAKDARQCLLIQLEHLRREGVEQPLAQALVSDHWEMLGTQSPAVMAKAMGATIGEVQKALQFIRDNLNPFPAQANWTDLHESPPEKEATYPAPDIIIGKSPNPSPDTEYEIELPGAQAHRLRISDSYLEARKCFEGSKASYAERSWEEWEAFYARARLFIKGVEHRWQTLRQLAFHLINYQRDFLAYGNKHLKPLTRAQLADMIGVHESTISRAVAGKYVQLPCGRIIPLARLFDSSVPVKEIIRELIAQEGEPLSDREIAELLAQRGYHTARRTVAKYRNALNIPPSSLR